MADKVTLEIRIKRVTWSDQEPVLAQLRRKVFIEEQHVPEEDEWDPADREATHFLALTPAGQPVGCGRLLASGKIGRMAVLPEFRQRGIGAALLHEIMSYGQENLSAELYLDAQLHALGFYQRAGFVAEGATFDDAGITHRRMRLSLPENTRSASKETLADAAVNQLSGPSEVLGVMRAYLDLGRHRVDILSDQLSAVVYGDKQVADAISALARGHRQAQVRILVKDTRGLHGRAHALVELAQRLPSRVTIRVLQGAPEAPAVSFAVVDKAAVVQLTNEKEWVGFARQRARAEAQQLLNEFDYLWEQYGATDPNLRTLVL